jgi:hypothetical protein
VFFRLFSVVGEVKSICEMIEKHMIYPDDKRCFEADGKVGEWLV